MKKVLITGMSGLIGGLLRTHLESLGGYELSALNRRPVDGVKCLQADIADLEAIKPAFEGVDVVVHLAAWVEIDDWEGNLSGNIIGPYNVYEASRLAGVKRVVFASSGSTIRAWSRDEPYKALSEGRYEDVPADFEKITHEMIRPDSLYGAAKVWGEAAGRHFADTYGMSVLCVRIGTVYEDNRPHNVHDFAVYLSHGDVVQILQRCIDAPNDLLYDVFLATSDNPRGYRDLDHAREVLGYHPNDSAEAFR
jgi:nucleoside-diphosphate-sugar epimerase